MNTQIYTEKDLETASDLLKSGKLLGIPTETVYGLAANGLDPKAVEKIFQVKGRPGDNPLILHLATGAWMERYCSAIPDKVRHLTDVFWPGPLTVILPAKSCVPSVVTAGLSTVGLRCPDHPLTLALLEKTNLPLAAPSGNLSGKPSPTTARAMLGDMEGKIPGILDGGACTVGVESTILAFDPSPRLLRAGGISVEAIEKVLGEKVEISMGNSEKPLAPGMKYRHYAPNAPVTVVLGKNSANYIAKAWKPGDGVICFSEYASYFPHALVQIMGKENDFTSQAQQVFSSLRFFDSKEVTRIWAQCPPEKGLGLAVANRLQKAASLQIVTLENDE